MAAAVAAHWSSTIPRASSVARRPHAYADEAFSGDERGQHVQGHAGLPRGRRAASGSSGAMLIAWGRPRRAAAGLSAWPAAASWVQ